MNSHAITLLMENRDALFAFILACVRNYADADDILQNVSVVIIEAAEVPKEPSQFLAWSREIARRRILEHFRASKRVLPVDPQTIERMMEAAERVDSKHSSQAQRTALIECIEKLSPENQQILTARYSDSGESNTEALSKRFGRSEQGVVSLLYRTRQRLRDCVKRRLRSERK